MKFHLLALAPLFLAGSASARVRGERKLNENLVDEANRVLKANDPNDPVAECWTIAQYDDAGCDALSAMRLNHGMTACEHVEDGHCVAAPAMKGERDGYCSVKLVTTVKGRKTYETYEEVEPCDEGLGYICFPTGDTGSSLVDGNVMGGICEIEYCNGKNEPGIKDQDEDQSNEATWRKTICHRTCSATNPWVRITIDNDAWGSDGLDAASGCGHQREHIVTDECRTTIEQTALKQNISFEEALVDIYGPNDRDYLLKDHGTRLDVRTANGWSDPNCQSTGQGVKCNGYSDEEKEYWFVWERACPYVRNGACCGHPLGWNGPCCGGEPYPDAKLTLKKYACKPEATCTEADIGDLCRDVTLSGIVDTDAKYCYRVENGPVVPICAVEVTDPKIDAAFMSAVGCLAANETKWFPDSVGTVFPAVSVNEEAIVTGIPSICSGGVVMESACEPLDGALPVTDKDPAELIGTPQPVPPQPLVKLDKYSCTADVASCNNAVLDGKSPQCVEDLEGRTGQPAKYCYKYKNIGETPLCSLSLTDADSDIGSIDMPTDCLGLEGEGWAGPASKNYPSPETSPLSTPASVCGTDSGTQVCASDDSTLRGYEPNIKIDKYSCNVHASGCDDASIAAGHCSLTTLTDTAGSDAFYCYRITNTGSSNLCNIEMKDLLSNHTSSVPGQSLSPQEFAWTEHSFNTQFPPPETQVETWGNVTGYACNSRFKILDQTPVEDSDPSGLASGPAPLPPLIPDVRMQKLSCVSDVHCSDSIQANATGHCVENLLEGIVGSGAKYCYIVTNTGNETICEVTVSDSISDVTDPDTNVVTTFPIPITAAEMPEGCMAPQAMVALSTGTDRTFPEDKEDKPAKVLAKGKDSNIEVTWSDPSQLVGVSSCPVDMGLTGTRANTELGGSCSGTAVYLENSILTESGLGGLKADFINIVDVFYAIESVTEERISFRVQNPFASKHDMYVRYHKPTGLGDAMEKDCVMEPSVDECAILENPIVAECINPADIDGNTSIKPYTVVDLYFVTIGQNGASHTDAKVDECCLEENAPQPADSNDVIQLTFVLDCYCPSQYTGSVARALRGN